MGSGKSTIGKELAGRGEGLFLDTDLWIEEKEGMTISRIFEQKGEPYFRDLETACLKELLGKTEKLEENFEDNKKEFDGKKNTVSGYVISVGGGLPVKDENRELLQQLGKVIYLKASSEVIYERIKEDTTRPLLQTPNPQQRIQELMAAREEKYEAAAHNIIIVDNKSIKEIVDEIERIRKQ